MLTGIRRLPALLCTDKEPQNMEQYEICMIEPLHDLKSVINCVFGELPNSIEDKELRDVISAAKTDLKGIMIHVHGIVMYCNCDCRCKNYTTD